MAKAFALYHTNLNGLLYGVRPRRLGAVVLPAINIQDQLNKLNQLNPTAKDIVTAGLKTTSQLGLKPTNTDLNSVAAIAGTVAQIAAIIPGGQAIAAVAGVVAGAALVVSAIIGNNAPNPYISENDQLRDQILTVDDQTSKVTQSLQTLSEILKQNGLNGLNGTPTDWANAQKAITDANADLQTQLSLKVKNLQSLIKNFNTAVTQTYNAVTGKDKTNKIILGTIITVAVIGFGWLSYEYFNQSK